MRDGGMSAQGALLGGCYIRRKYTSTCAVVRCYYRALDRTAIVLTNYKTWPASGSAKSA